MSRLLMVIAAFLLFADISAAAGLDAKTVNQTPDGGQTYTLSIQILLFMTALTLLPGALMMTTSFARILIVLNGAANTEGTKTSTDRIVDIKFTKASQVVVQGNHRPIGFLHWLSFSSSNPSISL